MATRIGRGATAAAVIRASCSSTERTSAPLCPRTLTGAVSGEVSLTARSPRDRRSPGPLPLGQAQSRHQPPPQFRAVVVTIQCKVNRSLEVAAGISQVVSRSVMHHDVDGMALFD